jgi:hypothetical protein
MADLIFALQPIVALSLTVFFNEYRQGKVLKWIDGS